LFDFHTEGTNAPAAVPSLLARHSLTARMSPGENAPARLHPPRAGPTTSIVEDQTMGDLSVARPAPSNEPAEPGAA
jgi:hypothetical protein